MGVQGVRGLGMKVWLKEYSLRILKLQTAASQGKQNICARIRPHAYAPQRFNGSLKAEQIAT